MNNGTHHSPLCSKHTATLIPIVTASIGTSTRFVVSLMVGSSSISTMAITYGGSKPGRNGWWFTVYVATVARPLTGVGSTSDERQYGHRGRGG